MEAGLDGGEDMTVEDCWQNQLGQMADFPLLLTFIIFDLYVPQIKSQTMQNTFVTIMCRNDELSWTMS